MGKMTRRQGTYLLGGMARVGNKLLALRGKGTISAQEAVDFVDRALVELDRMAAQADERRLREYEKEADRRVAEQETVKASTKTSTPPQPTKEPRKQKEHKTPPALPKNLDEWKGRLSKLYEEHLGMEKLPELPLTERAFERLLERGKLPILMPDNNGTVGLDFKSLMALAGWEDHWIVLKAEKGTGDKSPILEDREQSYWFSIDIADASPRLTKSLVELEARRRLPSIEEYAMSQTVIKNLLGKKLDTETGTWLRNRTKNGNAIFAGSNKDGGFWANADHGPGTQHEAGSRQVGGRHAEVINKE